MTCLGGLAGASPVEVAAGWGNPVLFSTSRSHASLNDSLRELHKRYEGRMHT